jgi:hypothetical protein
MRALGARPPMAEAMAKPMRSDHEHAFAAGVVRDPATEEQQSSECERVGGDHPLPVGVGDSEIVLGLGKGDGDDR